MTRRQRIFISSVQREFAEERRALREYVATDPLLSEFFTTFLFEELPAKDQRADAVYLSEVKRSDVYVGLIGDEYGSEDAEGVSPTEREFDRATELGKHRLIFIRKAQAKKRHRKTAALIAKAEAQLIRRSFSDIDGLRRAIFASLVARLRDMGIVRHNEFEDRTSAATLADLNIGAIRDFVRSARDERQFPLPVAAEPEDVLAHLHLLGDGKPTHAGVLLFGRDVQRFFPAAEVRCMHFHGTEVARPAPFYRVFKGTLFEQVDLALDFVLSKINREIGTRERSARAPERYELPPNAVREAIVNAVAHRDYTSAGAVQVSVFSDRVEVRNPGELPRDWTIERLLEPHGSVARNARICEALFLTRYIEKYGTGTLMIVRECREHGLAEPGFAQSSGEFVTTLWREWFSPELLGRMGLSARQQAAVMAARREGGITNARYQEVAKVARTSAKRDLDDLVRRGLLIRAGSGRGARYELRQKRSGNGPSGPRERRPRNGP